jgi:hypothetical protein
MSVSLVSAAQTQYVIVSQCLMKVLLSLNFFFWEPPTSPLAYRHVHIILLKAVTRTAFYRKVFKVVAQGNLILFDFHNEILVLVARRVVQYRGQGLIR